ncbi:beta-glucosidase [Arthrobacter sp. zg-Y20]|uniref:GH1 family beta-glucosidase n=1 Tax=unclassified Arthrobacter TaxID=235627 RepID=UPI001D151771|nr:MULTISPECIES: GH1 family beta-glucosidase [unclassified Arthrobacter]MCC3275933.1 beta-glucosidase [Arthrobacter sp. zg-Y20]MDK1316090.1 GH1 family beta-glucosidase [Arthrobacter sp. zg.Y20]WIB05620.1 GH1 family beta-glucosidase [Arthrobacter sp. zg-Y20]
MTQHTNGNFPTGFLWGAATAAYQIEGGAWEDGRKASIWDTFSRVPGAVVNAENGDVACDHYHRFDEDVALMKSLNLASYRFSTSWARIRPDGGAVNPAGLDFYSRLTDKLLDAGIKPWLTLYHWDLPQALQDAGGWANRDTAYRFAEYALSVHDALGDRVKAWTTLNEPWCSAYLGYASGEHAPGLQDRSLAVAANHHLLLGHGLAAQELKARDASLDVGLTLNFTVADPLDPENPDDVDAARRIDGQFNRVFADPVFRGSYPEDVLADLAPYGLVQHIGEGDMAVISTPVDFLGVNYYHGEAVTKTRPATLRSTEAPVSRPSASPYPAADGVYSVPRGLPVTNMGWEIQPEGLHRLLLRLQRDYTGPAGVPLYITENGAAFDDDVVVDGVVQDEDRLGFIEAHLQAVRDAAADGVDVRGYFAWSLMDNFEWAWGYAKRFGIVHVDYQTQVRTPKASARWFAETARTNALPERSSAAAPDVVSSIQ